MSILAAHTLCLAQLYYCCTLSIVSVHFNCRSWCQPGPPCQHKITKPILSKDIVSQPQQLLLKYLKSYPVSGITEFVNKQARVILVRAACMRLHGTNCPLLKAFCSLPLFSRVTFLPEGFIIGLQNCVWAPN